MERNRQKLASLDKDSLTEQQTKGTVTTTIQIRRIHKTKRQNTESNSHRLPPRALLRRECLLATPLPPTGTRHDSTWYGMPCSV